MVTCPWCGTSQEFQSNCINCGGPLPQPVEPLPVGREKPADEAVLMPPPPPRSISDRYIWKLLLADGWGIAALVFALLGAIFTPLGVALTIGIITAFVGVPFVGMGVLFLAGGVGVGAWRYKSAQQTVTVMRLGKAVQGKILEVNEVYNVEVNGRHPWTIRYEYKISGQTYTGEITTLNRPGENLREGMGVCVLYLPDSPGKNALYPLP